MKSRRAEKVQTKIDMMIFGAPFTGKTTLGLQLAKFVNENGKPFRVIVFDCEGGGVDYGLNKMLDEGVDGRNIVVFYTESLQEINEILDKVKNKEDIYYFDDDGNETNEVIMDADSQPFRADAVLIDGATVLRMTSEQGLLELSKKRNTVKADKDGLIGNERFVKIQGSDLEIKDYKALKRTGQNFVLDLVATGINVVITSREKDDNTSFKDSYGNSASASNGKKTYDTFNGMGDCCHMVLHMFRDETNEVCAEVIKDRSETHTEGEIIRDPSLLDWQHIITNNAGKKEFTLGNNFNEAVRAEQKMYENQYISQEDAARADTAESLVKKIDDALKTKNGAEKNALQAELKKRNIPTQYRKITDTSVLKQIFDVVKG